MENQAGLSIPKDRLRVSIALLDGSDIDGAVFLEQVPGEQAAFRRVASLLETGTDFLPVLRHEGGAVLFVNTEGVKTVELADSMDTEAVSGSLELMHMEHIEMILTDGSAVKGDLVADVPAERARLSDCLNLPARFLCIRAGETFCFINKRAVHMVRYTDQTNSDT